MRLATAFEPCPCVVVHLRPTDSPMGPPALRARSSGTSSPETPGRGSWTRSVEDPYGNAIPGVDLAFEALTADGAISATYQGTPSTTLTVTTDALGEAEAYVRLSTTPSTNADDRGVRGAPAEDANEPHPRLHRRKRSPLGALPAFPWVPARTENSNGATQDGQKDHSRPFPLAASL